MRDTQTVRQAIEERIGEIVAAIYRGDADGVAAVYSEDARLMPPGGKVISGRAAVREFWQGMMDMGFCGVELQTMHLEEAGDLAYEVNTAILQFRPEGGAETKDTVRHVAVWKRQPGGPWEVAAHMWNIWTPTPGTD